MHPARAALERSLLLSAEIGEVQNEAYALHQLGGLDLAEARHEPAITYLRPALVSLESSRPPLTAHRAAPGRPGAGDARRCVRGGWRWCGCTLLPRPGRRPVPAAGCARGRPALPLACRSGPLTRLCDMRDTS